MKSQKIGSVEKRKSRNGFLFVLPWLVGCLLFFISPMLQSVAFSFSDVRVATDGLETNFVGLKNFLYVIYESPEYMNNFSESLSEFAYQVPVIIVLSLIIAICLNGKFKGRTFFRSLFFIPVIFATSVVMNFIAENVSLEGMRDTAGALQNVSVGSEVNFESVFRQMGIPSSATKMVFRYINTIFNLIWQCGVHIILFISGLQSIPDQLYEVSRVEGASKWEEFWYITVPLLGNTIVLVFVFSVIEFCVRSDNAVVNQAYTVLLDQQIYGKSSAMLWFYFLIMAAIVGALYLLFNRSCLKKWQ